MKKISIIALTLVLTAALCACGRRNNNTAPTTVAPTTMAPTIIPSVPGTEPTVDTRLPEHNTETRTPGMDEGTAGTEHGTTGTTDTTGDAKAGRTRSHAGGIR